MKQFVKDNLCLVVILGIVALLILSLGIWGITKLISSDDKKLDNNQTNNPPIQDNSKPEKGKYDSINDAKDLVNSDSIDKLYKYVLGMSYRDNSKYISELYQDKKLEVDDLSDETIIRTAIFQLSTCDREYTEISYELIQDKIKEIFGITFTIDSDIYIKLTTGGYNCSNGKCIFDGGNYCTTGEVDSDYELVSVAADLYNSNILYLYEENESGIMYRHAFKKDNDNYYWYYIEPLGK